MIIIFTYIIIKMKINNIIYILNIKIKIEKKKNNNIYLFYIIIKK